MKEQSEMLEPKSINSYLSLENRGYLSRLEIFASLDSTNSYLLRQLKLPEFAGSKGWVCIADEQTQGRGRQGREWFSPRGANIYCSLTWSFPKSFQALSALSLAAGAMLLKALQKLGVKEGLGLKWPNDLLLQGRKVAGLLLEGLPRPREQALVLGVGLNLVLPQEKAETWIGLEEVLGSGLSRNRVLGLMLEELLTGLRLFEAQGFAPFLELCRAHDLLLGKELCLSTPTSQCYGLAQGINERGELLLLDAEQKLRAFCYGEVSARSSAT